jgi:hypothetical protein
LPYTKLEHRKSRLLNDTFSVYPEIVSQTQKEKGMLVLNFEIDLNVEFYLNVLSSYYKFLVHFVLIGAQVMVKQQWQATTT